MRRWITALALYGAVAAASAAPARYALDPVHTRVLVAIDHAGFSQALGTVSGSTGVVRMPEDGWDGASLEVAVPLSKLDFGDAAWNRAVQARTLLDTTRHPQARFTSSQVTAIDATRATVCGTLQLRGVEGPLCLDVVRNGVRRHPMPPFRRTAGFSATGTLSRAAFGIAAWPRVIGDAVALRIEAEAVRDDDAAAPAVSDAAAADAPPDAIDFTAPDPDPTP